MQMVAWIDKTSGMIVFTTGGKPKVKSFVDEDANQKVCTWKRYGIEESTGNDDSDGKTRDTHGSTKLF